MMQEVSSRQPLPTVQGSGKLEQRFGCAASSEEALQPDHEGTSHVSLLSADASLDL